MAPGLIPLLLANLGRERCQACGTLGVRCYAYVLFPENGYFGTLLSCGNAQCDLVVLSRLRRGSSERGPRRAKLKVIEGGRS